MKSPVKLNARQRWLILGGLLVATVAAALMADEEPAEPPQRPRPGHAQTPGQKSGAARPAARAGAPVAGVGEPIAGALAYLEAPVAPAKPEAPEPADGASEESAAPPIDPFRAKTWYVPPPPPPPPKPTAPPLPFQYLGKVMADGEVRVFLNHQGKHLVARVGDVIAGTYSVEEIGGGRMTFLYQPLKERQTLAIGGD